MQFNRGTDVLPLQYKAQVTPSPAPRATRVFQQSVTLHAYMEGYPKSTDEVISDTGWFIWGITEAQLPILVGAAAGGFVLMFTLLGLIIWRCCQHQKDKEKQYCFQRNSEEQDCQIPNSVSSKRASNDSVVFVGTTNSVTSRLAQVSRDKVEIAKSSNGISRSLSAPLKSKENNATTSLKPTISKKRPHSQPLRFSTTDITFTPHGCSSQHLYSQPENCNNNQLPGIPEIRLLSTETLDSESQSSTYSAYDYTFPRHQLHMDPNSGILKTRSLPTWVRSQQRPLSTEDDLSELYAKVSFNKKRKNRMHNDSAAAIALNKSRSQFIHFPFMHKDTDSLVDNEAVVVYDERTAL